MNSCSTSYGKERPQSPTGSRDQSPTGKPTSQTSGNFSKRQRLNGPRRSWKGAQPGRFLPRREAGGASEKAASPATGLEPRDLSARVDCRNGRDANHSPRSGNRLAADGPVPLSVANLRGRLALASVGPPHGPVGPAEVRAALP